eukprot:Phypoly_transcript_14695.p1 GENE.Phypoly_transcript_14695~~Phypoly_transcript_14695.p1  ORF type:complete len:179 (+),score=31.73 Phypoly_transcript_14695:369-905(+)
MGNIITRWVNSLSVKDTRILMLGLDAAGKTTIVYKLKLGDVVQTIPTIGFNVETIEYKKLRMTMWDVGGQDKIRPLWRHYFLNSQGLIFVVDSNDRERTEEAKEELHKLLGEAELAGVPVLIFANKQDLPNSIPLAKLTEELDMHKEKSRKWFVQSCSATTGMGVYEGLDWLSRAIYP